MHFKLSWSCTSVFVGMLGLLSLVIDMLSLGLGLPSLYLRMLSPGVGICESCSWCPESWSFDSWVLILVLLGPWVLVLELLNLLLVFDTPSLGLGLSLEQPVECIMINIVEWLQSTYKFVNVHVSTMSFMVCCHPHRQTADLARHHLCRFTRHRPWPVQKWFSRNYMWQGRLLNGTEVEQSLTSYQSHYRSYRGQVFTGQMTQPTVLKHWRKIGPKD